MSTETLAWLLQHAPEGDLPPALARWWSATQSLEDRIWLLAEFTRVQFVAEILRELFHPILAPEEHRWFSDFARWSGPPQDMPRAMPPMSSGAILTHVLVTMVQSSDCRRFAREIASGLIQNAKVKNKHRPDLATPEAISEALREGTRCISIETLTAEIDARWTRSPS